MSEHYTSEAEKDAFESLAALMGAPVKRILEIVRSMGEAPTRRFDFPDSAPESSDPRERALYIRQHRNTGPGKPIQEQRRRR